MNNKIQQPLGLVQHSISDMRRMWYFNNCVIRTIPKSEQFPFFQLLSKLSAQNNTLVLFPFSVLGFSFKVQHIIKPAICVKKNIPENSVKKGILYYSILTFGVVSFFALDPLLPVERFFEA